MKPSIPKGTRDLGPQEMYRRNHIFSEIRKVFETYGYQPIETPALENLSTLLGKYGDEGDKLLFRILNSGDFLSGNRDIAFDDYTALSAQISDKGLRYDLTVPFARFVVMNQNDLTFPFKRYQIQAVWRADRPQRGRYREFYQCDADVIGSRSLLNEAELLEIVDQVFGNLGVSVAIHLNNRKILSGIADIIGASDKMVDITVAIDKIDKIGLDEVVEDLAKRGLSKDQIERLKPILMLGGSNADKLLKLKEILTGSASGLMGIAEIEKILDYVQESGIGSPVVLDLTLARGLDYYTGAIIEVKARDINFGSICGGGRYDDLTGVFGLPNMSGVGISFGADRIYDVMNELNLFPESQSWGTHVLFSNFGPQEEMYCLPILAELRRKGIASEIYPEYDKLKKQLNYANKKKIRFVVLVGDEEMEQGKVTLKDMVSGLQETIPIPEMIERV